MALNTGVTPSFQVLPGGDDSRMPAGIWQARANIEGDGSGGLQTIDIILALSGHPRNQTMLFSLEHIFVSEEIQHTSPVATESVLITVSGFTLNPFNTSTGIGAGRSFSIPLTDVGGGATASPAGNWQATGAGRPWVLGYPGDNTQARIRATFPNIPGLDDLFQAEGQFWLQEAGVQPSGPRQYDDTFESIQPLNYGNGHDAYYAELRRGISPAVAAPTPIPAAASRPMAAQIVGIRAPRPGGIPDRGFVRPQPAIPATPATPAPRPLIQSQFAGSSRRAQDVGLQASVRATDTRLAESIAAEAIRTGASQVVATSRILGQSQGQVFAQRLVAAFKGKKVPPGAGFANLTGRFEEGNGGIF